jgi:predicted cupin superfamily sugar epimerase
VNAREVIERLRLEPHPEGGWYRETWRPPETSAGRPAGTAILFLLAEGDASRWHRIDADEVWAWHGGAPLQLVIAGEGGAIEPLRLGMDPGRGEVPQAVVPAGSWQSARPLGAWALVSCIVFPGFLFEGFEMAAEGWRPDDPSRASPPA